MKDGTRWLNSYSGWIFVVIFTTIPVMRLLMTSQADFSTMTSYGWFSLFGRASSLMGITLFSINLILSTRHQLLEKFFYGLNKVYVAHHLIGGTSLIFLLVHPLLLSLRFIPSDWYQAAQLLIPSITEPIDWPLNFGIIALYGMIFLMVVTIFIKLHYELWLWTHKFLGLVFFLGVLHSFLIPSDISSDSFLGIYFLIVSSLGLCAYIYTTLMGTFIIRKYPYLVDSVVHVNQDVLEIRLKPIRHVIPYQAGQFVFIRFFQDGIPTQQHPFSVSSAPDNGKNPLLTVTVKGLGDYTNILNNLSVDTEAEVEGSFGKFSYTRAKYTKQIWIAGGIGITPFLSMAQDLKDKTYEIALFYSVKTRNELVGIDTLNSIAQNKGLNFDVYPFIGDEQDGYISADYIVKTLGEIAERDIFICGPPGMMKALRQQFRSKGIANHLIHSEEFSID
ncbi:ferredoxin reductase family protein [candidate division WWE3 bacterium]|uniref:Ferredoxin reductase family protein n=1 Tax=candidate division WWE3 bacterium TaxID=2053526 RepID=A0A955LH60_UNCKA|nr:ferredoxin reductase family protein [candidate division WWE3 bacterium]